MSVATKERPALTAIGSPPWTRAGMLARLEEFAEVYERRPITDNAGGMCRPHMFLFWFALQHLKPTTIIESGVWQGQGTWFAEQACPAAEIHCIDLDWSHLKYRSGQARYHGRDFAKLDWSGVDRERALVFFDDHVNAVQRVEQSHAMGFRHLLFEDNYYPKEVSDFYTLKLAFAGDGYEPIHTLRRTVARVLGIRPDHRVKPNPEDAARLRTLFDIYEEMPPVFKLATTRWGIPWDERLPTPDPLLNAVTAPWQRPFLDEAKWYTWFAYVGLRPNA